MSDHNHNGLYIHLRRFGDSGEGESALEITTTAAAKAHQFFKKLEQESRAAQLLIEGALGELHEMQRDFHGGGSERTHGLDKVETAYRKLSLVMTAYALFKATLGDVPTDLVAVNETVKEITEGKGPCRPDLGDAQRAEGALRGHRSTQTGRFGPNWGKL